MRPDQFTRSLPLLPPPVAERAHALRRHLSSRHCDQCQQVADALKLAIIAARYDDVAAATRLVETAERLAAGHDTPRAGSCALPPTWPATSGVRGQVTRWLRHDGPLVAATDASWKDRTAGIGYVVSDGRFGLRGRTSDRLDPTGPSRVLINELRAVEFLLADPTLGAEPVTVLVDSTGALSYLQLWRGGETGTMPTGYNLRPRARGGRPTLVRLAQRVADLPQVTFEHVRGHTGHLLNEAADALSAMARRRLRERFDHRARARDLVDAFLTQWHTTNSPSPR
ncbi:RNase H family protein [Plantactinospora sp. B24E8]|uniref:ribonuclease HI n=1 Tax=Plantactinospora sp. B24E8 TaxID=3153567 RepID=UPI00325E8513